MSEKVTPITIYLCSAVHIGRLILKYVREGTPITIYSCSAVHIGRLILKYVREGNILNYIFM